MAIKNVVLIGAGGNLGPHILQGLLDASFNVTVVTRHSSKSTFPSTVKVAKIADDYPHDEAVAIFKGHDAVISTIAGLAIAVQKSLIDAAVEAGVTRFLPTEFGSNVTDPSNPVFALKGELREYLMSKEAAGLSWTAVACSAFFEWGIEVGFLRLNIREKKQEVLDSGDQRFPVSTWRTIGTGTAGVLLHPEETKNRWVHIQSFAVTLNELREKAEQITGDKFAVTHLDSATWVPEQIKKFQAGDIPALYGMVWAHVTENEDWSDRLDNELLGVPKEDFDEVMTRVVKGITKA